MQSYLLNKCNTLPVLLAGTYQTESLSISGFGSKSLFICLSIVRELSLSWAEEKLVTLLVGIPKVRPTVKK